MPSYTSNKLLSMPTVTGDSGVWGTALNDNTISPVDLMLGGVRSIGLSATTYTLSATDIQYLTVKLTGTLLADITVYSSCVGFYIVENNTTGAHTVTWQTTSAPSGGTPAGSGIVLVQGSRTLLTADLTVGVRVADTDRGSTAIPSGTKMLFFQAAAPTGWTQVTSYNDYTLRIVSGTGGGFYSAGQAFSTAVCAGTVAGHAVTTAEMPVHNHGVTDPTHAHSVYDPAHHHVTPSPLFVNAQGSLNVLPGGNIGIVNNVQTSASATGIGIYGAYTGISIQNTGSGSTHTHGFTGSALNVKYIDCILCQRN
jgi:hypothetical protein